MRKGLLVIVLGGMLLSLRSSLPSFTPPPPHLHVIPTTSDDEPCKHWGNHLTTKVDLAHLNVGLGKPAMVRVIFGDLGDPVLLNAAMREPTSGRFLVM